MSKCKTTKLIPVSLIFSYHIHIVYIYIYMFAFFFYHLQTFVHLRKWKIHIRILKIQKYRHASRQNDFFHLSSRSLMIFFTYILYLLEVYFSNYRPLFYWDMLIHSYLWQIFLIMKPKLLNIFLLNVKFIILDHKIMGQRDFIYLLPKFKNCLIKTDF